MSYNYQAERSSLFTEKGCCDFIKIRDNTFELLELAGAVRIREATQGIGGSTFFQHACMDRMIEMKEIREMTGPNACGQDRVFVHYEQ